MKKNAAGHVLASLFTSSIPPDTSAYAVAAAAGTGAGAATKSADIEVMKADIERLMMVTEALWTMLKDQFEYTDAHLVQRIAEIDARDGKVDGRVSKEVPPNCPGCGRPVSRKAAMCLYCGAQVPVRPFAR